MVSSTVGWVTNTGWKRRARAASFSMCLRYSSSVVAPMQCSSPRASAGFSMFDASIEPSARPAPTRLCSSSMNSTTSPAAGQLLQHRLQALLELAAIFRAGDQGAEIEREEPTLAQALRHVAVDDALRQALGDRSLADPGLADQHRVVLGPAREHLDHPADLLVAADHRVELALTRGFGEIAGVFLQRIVALLGRRAVRGPALPQRLDRAVQRLRRHAGLLERVRGFGAGGHGQRHQDALDRHEAVARLLRELLGLVEQARGFRRQEQLAGPGALDPRQPGERRLGQVERALRIAARRPDQVGREALRIVEQHLEHVLGREALMPLAQGERLRRLDKASRALRMSFQIHRQLPCSTPEDRRSSPARPALAPRRSTSIWVRPPFAQDVSRPSGLPAFCAADPRRPGKPSLTASRSAETPAVGCAIQLPCSRCAAP